MAEPIYISSSGYKTHNTLNLLNKKRDQEGIKWKALYDGNKADIDLDLIKNDRTKHYNMSLDADELKQLYNDILVQPSINIPLDQRLMNDFLMMPNPPPPPKRHRTKRQPRNNKRAKTSKKSSSPPRHLTHISTPKPNEVIRFKNSTNNDVEKVLI